MQKYYVAIILGILFFFFVLTAIRAWRARAAKQEADFTQPGTGRINQQDFRLYEQFQNTSGRIHPDQSQGQHFQRRDVHQQAWNGFEGQISMREFPSGVYILEVSSGNKSWQAQVVVH